MSFTNHKSTKHRPAIILAVATLHAAALYALVTGLGVTYFKEVIANLPARSYPADPPPPEPAPDPRKPDSTDETAQPAPVPRQKPWELPDARLPDILIPGPLPPPDGPFEIDLPKPPPSFTPAGPRPKGNPGSWATTSDYPTRDIRQGNEGTAGFRLEIDATGRVVDCAVTRSSGHPGLDEATCRNVSRRARFEPATDARGGTVAGTYSGSIKWVIPD